MKATKTRWSSEDVFMEWLREFASLTSPTSNPHKAIVLIVDGSKTDLSRASIEEAVKLGVHLVAPPSHFTEEKVLCLFSPPPPWGAFNWRAGEWGPAPL